MNGVLRAKGSAEGNSSQDTNDRKLLCKDEGPAKDLLRICGMKRFQRGMRETSTALDVFKNK